jgi:thioredoxin 1
VELPKSFNELIAVADRPVLVDFWAEWCGPCRVVSPALQQIAREYSGRMIAVKVNVDKKPQISQQYQIASIPTIMLFWKGQPVMRLAGALPIEEIRKEIDSRWPLPS